MGGFVPDAVDGICRVRPAGVGGLYVQTGAEVDQVAAAGVREQFRRSGDYLRRAVGVLRRVQGSPRAYRVRPTARTAAGDIPFPQIAPLIAKIEVVHIAVAIGVDGAHARSAVDRGAAAADSGVHQGPVAPRPGAVDTVFNEQDMDAGGAYPGCGGVEVVARPGVGA